MTDIQKRLFELQDLKYRDFHSRLMPTVNKELVIGVRTPELRKLAKEISKTEYAAKFLKILPHKYYEENNLHAFLIEGINDYGKCIKAVEEFLPYIDNWATCDSLRPKIFKKHTTELEKQAFEWIDSGREFTVRYGIECLMMHFLGDNFSIDHAHKIASVDCSEYYVSMMVAWYFATALAMQTDAILPIIERGLPDGETQKRTIRKATESFRISKELKQRLANLQYSD
jgi:3-methyladenine DNA glycosylase AlkD